MTTAHATFSGRDAHVDAAPIVEAKGWRKVSRWAVDGAELVAVGLAVPIAILVAGTPIVLAVLLVL